MGTQNASDASPSGTRRLMYEAVRLADAMGLVDQRDVSAVDDRAVRKVIARARSAGIARLPAAALSNVEQPSTGGAVSHMRATSGHAA